MYIKYTTYYSDDIQIEKIEDFAASKLDGADHERGALEEAQATADNAVKAIGRLVDILIGSRLLTAEQVVEVLYPNRIINLLNITQD